MTSISQNDFLANGHEKSMFVQPPSSGRCQDVSHLLTRIFREDFTKDAIDQDTVRNLTTSKSGKIGYHDQYVEKLHQIQKQWENRMEDADKIEKHMQDAYNNARENEAVQEKKSSDECASFKELGLPSVQSHLDNHLNSHLLRRFNLIVPQDFIEEERKLQFDMKDDGSPQYARPTTSSMQRYRKTPVEDNYFPEETGQLERATEEPTLPSNHAEILKISHSLPDAIVKTAYEKNDGARIEEKNIWRKLMKPSQRQVEREDLAKLQQKADYLKNPRFLPPKSVKESTGTRKITNGESTQAVKTCKAADIFEASPCPVLFTDYEAGNEYEIVLTLKNITSSSRQLRVLPPSTPYFAVSHGKFPTSDGLVAPGMSCQYVIKFSPDSLADYDDSLKVETKFSEPLIIQLQARRPPPELSLPDTFACGHCLVGGSKTVQLPCINSGGEGRFVILAKDEWKSRSFQELYDKEEEVSIGPFVIQPSSFHLQPNDCINLTMSFSPDAVKKFQEHLVMLCDNCQIKKFTIEGFGETAGVELVSVKGGLSSYEIGESKDARASCLVKFPDRVPGTQEIKQLEIRNATSVDLEYYWQIDRPVYAGHNRHMLHNDCNQGGGQPAAFEVQPSSGKLTSLGISAFSLSFQPIQLGIYRNVARLILRNVPCTEDQNSVLADLVTIQIELKGGTKIFDVSTHPEVVTLDCNVEINVPHHLEFTVFNNSSSPCPIAWENIEDEECSVRIEPNGQEIGPNSRSECYVTCVGKKPGLVRRTLFGKIPHRTLPAYCHFELHFTGPAVRFLDRLLNFGLVRHKNDQKRLVELKNFSSIDAHWSLNESNMDLLTLEPVSGVIESNSMQVILVHLKADSPCILNEIIEIEIDSGENCYLEARAIIEMPEVVLLKSGIAIEECFTNIPVSQTVALQNLTLFSVEYKWTKVLGKDSELCDLHFTKAEGTLKPREKLETEFILCVKKQGTINDLFAVCEIEGMVHPLILSIAANVSGLKVDFATPDVSGMLSSPTTHSELKLEFGYDVPISSNPKTVVVMKNNSAISASFSIYIDNFKGGRLPTPPEKKRPDKQESKTRSLPLLSKTDTKADLYNRLSSKAFKDLCDAALSDGKGAAFLPNPSQGQLGPFEQIIIEVTAYVDMWGEYNDKLICIVDGLKPVEVPIHLECSGCPLKFQFSKDPNPVLRFGSHISGGDIHSRALKINNQSPCDIRVDWRCYSSENEDTQLLDLLVMIGNPFPPLDKDGQEVELEDDLEEPLIRVKLNPHQGKIASIPFAVEPKQMIIPAKSSTQATARFIPFENAVEKMDVQGYALGFMSLLNQDKFHEEGRTLRCDGIDVPPFHLNFTGSIKPARVIVETESESGFVFETVASNLLRPDGNSSYKIAENFVTTDKTGRAIVKAPNTIKNAAKSFPSSVPGTISPYPRTTTVCTAHQSASGMLLNSVLSRSISA
ncbi:deleted in lung and esophageal cancer protein 1-like isoform X2 [Rhopilema esculentum]|uniref:deleted in lung and esophageal cancer protein 1-like isoform X2 n=1 Tax=Rhopilema esculentum TaxID=499914 RepID=UPI0031D877E4